MNFFKTVLLVVTHVAGIALAINLSIVLLFCGSCDLGVVLYVAGAVLSSATLVTCAVLYAIILWIQRTKNKDSSFFEAEPLIKSRYFSMTVLVVYLVSLVISLFFLEYSNIDTEGTFFLLLAFLWPVAYSLLFLMTPLTRRLGGVTLLLFAVVFVVAMFMVTSAGPSGALYQYDKDGAIVCSEAGKSLSGPVMTLCKYKNLSELCFFERDNPSFASLCRARSFYNQ